MKNKQKIKSVYELLGISRNSDAATLKSNWQTLSRKMHPDKNNGSKEATDAFAELSMAYAILSDTKERKKYNQQLDLMSAPCEVCKGEGEIYKQKGFTARIASICGNCHGSGRV